MLSLTDYGQWILPKNQARIDAYANALKECVKKDSVVLDVGAGTGILSLLSCKYGAKKCYAVDIDPSILHLEKIAQENGFSDRISAFHSKLQDINLPEKVDIIVSDVHGVTPYSEEGLFVLKLARDKFLKVDGIMLPQTDKIFVSPVKNISTRELLSKPWEDSPYGIKMTSLKEASLNSFCRATLVPEDLALEKREIATVDYSSFTNLSLSFSEEWTAPNDTQISGFVIWFDCEMYSKFAYSNAPSLNPNPSTYGQLFFPARETIELRVGETLNINVSANYLDGKYVWGWKFETDDSSGRGFSMDEQSNFVTYPLPS